MAFKGHPAWSSDLPDFHCCTFQDCRPQLPPGDPVRASLSSSAPALAIRSKGKALGVSEYPANQIHARGCFRRLISSLSLRPSWLLASWSDRNRKAQCPPSLPKTFTSGLSVQRVTSQTAGYNYGAKLRIAPAGLSPASTAASLAAPLRPACPGRTEIAILRNRP